MPKVRHFTLTSSIAIAALLAQPAVAQDSEAIDIFGLFSLSGGSASYGEYAEMGARLAVEQLREELGRDVNLHVIDTESNAGAAVRKVQEAINQHGARLFQGTTLSSTALAVGEEVARVDGVFGNAVGADEVTGSSCNASMFRWSVPTYGAIQETVRPLIELHPEATRWYTVTPDYVFGHDLLNNAIDVFDEYGIEHVGNSTHAGDVQEFSGILVSAQAANPDVLLLLNFDQQATNALRQARSFGMHDNMIILVAWSAGLHQFQELGPDNTDGIYFGAQYWHEAESDSDLLDLVRDQYGITANFPIAANYTMTRSIVLTAHESGSVGGADHIAAMEGFTYQGPTGEEQIRAFDHQVIKDYYLLQGKGAAEMEDEDDFADIVSFGQSFVSEENSECEL